MKEAQEFQVGDIVEVLAIVALQRDLYLPKDADWRQFIGKQYRVSFVGKMPLPEKVISINIGIYMFCFVSSQGH